MTTSGTTSDNEWQQVTTSESEWQRVGFFCQQYGVGMNILKTKRSFLITPEVIAHVFKTYVNLFTRCHSMYHSHVFRQTIQENYVRNTLKWPLCTIKCEVVPVQFTFSSNKTVSFRFNHFRFALISAPKLVVFPDFH